MVRGGGDQRRRGRLDHLGAGEDDREHPGQPAGRPLSRRPHEAARVRGDDGAASSLAITLLAPLATLLAFAAVQAALWSHARTEARVVARDTAALIGRGGVATDDARESARAVLAADTDLSDIAVDVSWIDGIVSVTIRGRAPGILIGTSADVTVTEAVSDEDAPR